MVRLIKKLSLLILLMEIIFISNLYAQSFKERIRQTVKQEAYRQRYSGRIYQNNSMQNQDYNRSQKKGNNNSSEEEAKSQDKKEATLTVFGNGKTKDEATKLALRSAIEQAFGVFVSSNTQILNDNLISDEIATVSSGNIKHYEYISEQEKENGYSVALKVTVSINQLIQYAESKGSKAEFAGNIFAMDIAMYELNKKNEAYVINHLCKEISSQIPYMYDYKISTLTPQKNKNNTWAIPIIISVITNKTTENICNTITNTFESISLSDKECNKYKEIGYDDIGKLTIIKKVTKIEKASSNTRTNARFNPVKPSERKFTTIAPQEYYFRNNNSFLNKIEYSLKEKATYQTVAFKIIDNFKECSMNIPGEYLANIKTFRYDENIAGELTQFVDYPLQILEFVFHDDNRSRFSHLLMQPSGVEIARIKMRLIYNSLDEIKQLKNISVEPTHRTI